jgi:hypothetical protein
MRIPSRRMPKSHHPTLSGWRRVVALAAMGALLLTIVGLYLRALVQAPIPFLGATAALVGAFAVWHYGWGRPPLRRTEAAVRALAAARAGQSICEFSRDFDLRAVDSWIVRAVYDELQSEMEAAHGLAAFPLRADDRMVDDLHLDPEDLDLSVAPAVADRACRSLDDWASNPFYEDTTTVRGLVLFLNAQPLVRQKVAA